MLVGTLALLSSQGIPIHLLCATRGEGGETGEPPVCDRQELGLVREQELRCAAEALGIRTVTILNYVDPLVGPDEALFPFECSYDTLVGQIREMIRRVGAEVVLSHGSDGEYGHPAHQLLHRATRDAVRYSAANPLFYSFAASVPGIEDRLWNDSDPAHLALDIRPWLDAKESAAHCHRSQHALFKRRKQAQTIRETLRTTESFHRHLPPVDGLSS
jgi:LmbE family N-acetylglucosaminyl deacetylase